MDKEAVLEQCAYELSIDPNVHEGYEIVRKNSIGEITLVGGTVYRRLAYIAHGIELKPNTDLDFIVPDWKKPLTTPELVIKIGAYGEFVRKGLIKQDDIVSSVRFRRGGAKQTIDMLVMRNLPHVQRPIREDYFGSVPLDIQAIGYDFKTRTIIGDVGINAVFNKEIRINNITKAREAAVRKYITTREVILSKSESLGFKAHWPDNATDEFYAI